MPIRLTRTTDAHPSALVLRPTSHTENTTGASPAASPAPVPFGLPTSSPGVLSAPALSAIKSSPEELRNWGRAAGEYVALIKDHREGEVILDLLDIDIPLAQFRHLVAGALEGIDEVGQSTPDSNSTDVHLAIAPSLTDESVELILTEELSIRRAIRLAIELTDARSNQLTPEVFAERASEIAQRMGFGFRSTGATELREQGFGGITAIGQGSAKEPSLVELWYTPGKQPGNEPPQQAIAIAGKGVTFDTGGLSLKPPTGMYSMHTDCAGAATVLSALVAHAEIGSQTPVYVALPLVENIPGPDSIRPGDVVTMRNGIGLEIIDTDFEGRVILADAAARLSESNPRALLSFATLTYQIQIALGPEIAGLFGRDKDLTDRMLTAAESAGEALWSMPWATRYADQLISTAPDAALRNHPLCETGRAITAALFIGEFVPNEIPFAHIDFAGPTVRNTPSGPAATGYGVRTIVELLRDWA